MVTSEIIKIKYTNDNNHIEEELRKLNIDPLRWAIVEANESELTLCVSYEC